MKKGKITVSGLVTVVMLVVVVGAAGFYFLNQQVIAKNFGGTVEIKLEENRKLMNVSWKDNGSLWYLTKPMESTDKAESYIYEQSRNFGLFEGKVIIKEVKK